MKTLGVDSIVIVLIISIFVGAAIVMQILLNLENPLFPKWIYGYTTRKAIMLELSPTIISLILAGKCASDSQRIGNSTHNRTNRCIGSHGS